MLSWVKNIFIRPDHTSTDYILKHPAGKRYYPEFHKIRKHLIDPDAQKVLGRLNQFGFKAYIVGGCVRDLLLNRQPKDYDIVTNATPNEIRKLFVNSRMIGRRFKIVHIVFKGNKVIEVSTARSLPSSREKARNKDELLLKHDNEYGSFKEDAARRDFTINSLFFDIRNESIIDYTGGFEDIKNKVVRIIGDENISLPEDPVRMLRAIKFAGLLNFELHSRLIRGIKRHRRFIQKASEARLHEEFNKLWRTGQSFEIFKKMVELTLFDAMFPQVARRLAELHKPWPKKFEQSYLGKRLQIADRMISEHEDINTNIYFSILGGAVMIDLFDLDPRDREIDRQIENRMTSINDELGLSKKEFERIAQMYSSQRQFHQEADESRPWVRTFKNKIFFPEAFTFYKIHVRANRDDAAIQRALFWEIGLRRKLPSVIRKVVPRPLQDGGFPSVDKSERSEKGGSFGRHSTARGRRPSGASRGRGRGAEERKSQPPATGDSPPREEGPADDSGAPAKKSGARRSRGGRNRRGKRPSGERPASS